MAVSDLTGTTWLINSSPTISPLANTDEEYTAAFEINFTFEEEDEGQLSGTELEIANVNDFLEGICLQITYVASSLYLAYNNGWDQENFKTITITGGTDATNADLIAWLEANAVQQVQPSSGGSIGFGTLGISKMYWGDAEVSKVYYGDTLIYEAGGTPTPSYYLYWTNASVYVDEENSYTYNGITLSLSSSTRVDYKSTGIVYQSSDLSLNGSTSALTEESWDLLRYYMDDNETQQDAKNRVYRYYFTITADTSYTIATTYHALSNLKNRTFLLDKITWSNKKWLVYDKIYESQQISEDEPYIITNCGFTSNGTHFKGFFKSHTSSGKSTTYNYIYVADDNSNVIAFTIESTTLTWTNSAYQTIKFDNLDLYDRVLEQWLLQFATEQ